MRFSVLRHTTKSHYSITRGVCQHFYKIHVSTLLFLMTQVGEFVSFNRLINAFSLLFTEFKGAFVTIKNKSEEIRHFFNFRKSRSCFYHIFLFRQLKSRYATENNHQYCKYQPPELRIYQNQKLMVLLIPYNLASAACLALISFFIDSISFSVKTSRSPSRSLPLYILSRMSE